MHHPRIRMVRRKAREYFSGSLMVLECIFEVMSVSQIFEQIRIRNSVGNVEFSHCLLSQPHRTQHTAFKIFCLTKTNQNLCLLLFQIGQKSHIMWLLQLDQSLQHLQFLETQLVLLLSIVYFCTKNRNLQVERVSHH